MVVVLGNSWVGQRNSRGSLLTGGTIPGRGGGGVPFRSTTELKPGGMGSAHGAWGATQAQGAHLFHGAVVGVMLYLASRSPLYSPYLLW